MTNDQKLEKAWKDIKEFEKRIQEWFKNPLPPTPYGCKTEHIKGRKKK